MAAEIYRLVGDDESCAVLTANPVRGDICVTRNNCWLGPEYFVLQWPSDHWHWPECYSII